MKRLFVFLAALLPGIQGALGAIVLRVDVSNPSAVTFTATGASSQFIGSGDTFGEGIYLWDFFSGNTTRIDTVLGDLATGGNSEALQFNRYYKGALHSLSLYISGESTPMVFTENDPALIGSAVINLSDFVAELPSSGYTGSISAGSTIGSYTVIPEPSWALLSASGLGVALVSAVRRRKKA